MSVNVVAVPLPHLHATTLVACLRGGPRFEGPRENGLTHLMEHVLFRGCGRYPSARELLSAFEALGDEPDAQTGDDELLVSATLMPDAVVRGARLVADVLRRPLWKDIAHERRIVLEERLEFVDERGRATDLDDVSRRFVFEGHPLGRPLVGEESDIKRFQRAHLVKHHARLVRDQNLVVAVAGPLHARDVAHVERAFAGFPRGQVPDDAPIPVLKGPRTAFVRSRGSAQCDVRFTFQGPGESSDRAATLRLLSGVLDGGATARLPERLVDPGFLYAASAGLVAFPDASLLEVDLTVSPEGLVGAVRRALEVVSSVGRGLARGELANARARVLVRRAFSRDDSRTEAEWHARRALFGLPADRGAELAAFERVRDRDVVGLAREMLVPGRFAVVLIGDPTKAQRAGFDRVVRRWCRGGGGGG